MTDLSIVRTPAEDALGEHYSAMIERLPRGGWVEARRREAFNAFVSKGLPHRRVEEWKFTDLRTMMRQANRPTKQYKGALDALPILADVDRLQFRIVNGFAADMPASLPEGLSVYRLRDVFGAANSPLADKVGALVDVNRDPVAALNTAFAEGGLIIKIEDGVELKTPIHIDLGYIGAGEETAYARVVVLMGKGAKASLIETHVSKATGYHTNVVVEATLDDGAELHHLKVQDETLDAIHLATNAFKLGKEAKLKTLAMHTGSALYRNNVNVTFSGEFAEASIGAGTMLRDGQHGDTTLFVDHAVPNCTSRELYKTVLDDKARGVFQGKILVRQPAQKTDGQMMTQGLMLSDAAELDAKPELEIYADDVQCAHGATMGELDEDLLFYLRSRGIPDVEAKALLVQAFIGEVFEVAPEGLEDTLEEIAAKWLKCAHTESLRAR